VLDSRYINHMTREKRILLRKMTQVIASHMETIVKAKFLTMLKLLSQPNILSLNFFLLNPWTNLLSVSQFCEMRYNCLFTNKGVTIFRRSDGSFVFKGVLRGKLYLVDFVPEKPSDQFLRLIVMSH
jgi:hypothetical protein